MENILEVKNLTKKFGNFIAVNDISFNLKEGEILGFLGVNGAGKTTTMQMLLGILTPTKGDISYFGKNLFSHKSEIMEQVNFSTTYTQLPWNLTVKENLTFISYLYNIPERKKRIEKIMHVFDLVEMANKQVATLSAGQKTKVNLAKAFINFPKVLLLDEPTASLDVETASEMRNMLLKERTEFNTSMLFTSHNMAEVEDICDRVIFIHDGKVIANDTPENLAKSIQISHVMLVLEKGEKKLLEYCNERNIPISIKKHASLIDIPEQQIANFLQNIGNQGITYREIAIEKPTLEDYFMQVVEKEEHEIT